MKIRLNKTMLAGLILLLLPLAEGRAQQEPQQPVVLQLTLEKAIEIAMSESPTVRVANLEIEKKQYARKGAESSLYPQIDAVGQYTRTVQKQVMYMDGAFDMGSMLNPVLVPLAGGIEGALGSIPGYNPGTFGQMYEQLQRDYLAANPPASGDEGITVGRDNNWTMGLTLNWPVIVPTLWKSLQLSSLDVELAVEEARASKMNLSNDIKKAYYGVLLAQDSYNVFKKSHDNAIMSYNDIKQKHEQGMASEFDLIRADVQVKSVKPNLIQAQNALNLATLSLKALMGVDMDLPLEAAGSLKDYEETLYADMIQADTSLANNPDLKKFDIHTEQLKTSLELYKAQYWPTVAISGQYMYMSMNNDFRFSDYKWNPYSTVGLSVSIPLFNGFKKQSNIRETKVSIEQMKWQREDVVRKLTLSVKNSVSSMTNYVEQVYSSGDVVKQAQKAYEIAQKRYETGMGTLLELNDALLAVTQTQLMYNQAIFNYLSSKADLAKTLGLE